MQLHCLLEQNLSCFQAGAVTSAFCSTSEQGKVNPGAGVAACCPAGAAPTPGLFPSLWSPLHWGPSLGCPGSGRGGCACTLPAALRAGCMGRDLGGPGRGQSVPEEPLHARQCAPKVAWVRVTHRAGGAQGCSPELWCTSGSPHCSELRHHVPRPFLFPANLRGELCLTPASSITALFTERVNNSLTSFLPMVFFLFYHLGLLGLN